MGEAPAILVDDLQHNFTNGFDAISGGLETVTNIGQKRYVIDGTGNEYVIDGTGKYVIDRTGNESFGVRIFDKNTSTWTIPKILGQIPKLCKGHSSVLLNEDRIMIIKSDATQDDSIWFLEVDTQFVRHQKTVSQTEVVAWSKGVIGDALRPIVISGPSGVGKGTLISKLMEEFPSMFGFSVSHTTRKSRNKEQDGIHYHFTERNVMEKEIRDGKFLEFASVHDNLYGTSVEAVEVVADAGKRCILDIDVQGAKSVSACPLEAIFVFIKPPSFQELEDRLRARGTETEQQIQKRLQNAKTEVEQGESSGIFDHILVNDNLEDCYKNLKKLLGLDDCAAATSKPALQTVDASILVDKKILPVSKFDKKILLNCGSQEPENSSKNLFVLDVSSLKGGAPGRTRGLKLYGMDSFSNGINGTKQLS